MSLFQCSNCGCCENTACTSHSDVMPESFDWTGIEDRKYKRLCCVCSPTKYSNGKPTEYGKWHDKFDRMFLPKGLFTTNRQGNLAHKETGDTDYRKHSIPQPTDI